MGAEIIGAVGLIAAATVSGILALLGKRFRDENNEQHAQNLNMLEMIIDDVGEVKDEVREVRDSQNRHLEWHLEKAE